MDVQRIAAFSKNGTGGNPAGVVVLDTPAPEADMARVAAEVGYSETAFAVALDAARRRWRVRYFSPESEVPFCGHATIGLGAVLGAEIGEGRFDLVLNDAEISVEASRTGPDGAMQAALTSPPTRSRPLSAAERETFLALFGLSEADLSPRMAPAHIHGGADHILLPLADRARLAAMAYDFEAGRAAMDAQGLITVMLVATLDDRHFAARNAFASGGVVEDPATGAAAAAFGGYLRDIDWPHGGAITITQGEDMGAPSLIHVTLGDTKGAPVTVAGTTRPIA